MSEGTVKHVNLLRKYYLKKKTRIIVLPPCPGYPPSSLKRTGLESSGLQIISANSITKRIAFSKHLPFGPMLSISRNVRVSVRPRVLELFEDDGSDE